MNILKLIVSVQDTRSVITPNPEFSLTFDYPLDKKRSVKTWFPQTSQTLQVQMTSDGKSTVLIPQLQDKKLLLIKLRDFPKLEGIFVERFVFGSGLKK